ncbi:hypothetical protein BURKHO8Y_110173 [Burkholderia sp. 8Y]|nr:hypothetical protein BURKHO8Y_110173 [Burkholderia sp. 8Y]
MIQQQRTLTLTPDRCIRPRPPLPEQWDGSALGLCLAYAVEAPGGIFNQPNSKSIPRILNS